jgi:hypothetical protein
MNKGATIVALLWAIAGSAFAQRDPAQPAEPSESSVPEKRDEQRPIGAEFAEPSKVDVFGYLKVGYFFTGPASGDSLIGSHNGFRLANLRVGVSFQPVARIAIVASVDGSVAKRQELDPLTGSRVVELRDAYGEWNAAPAFRLRAGQFKAPYNAENLLGDGALPFISRSIITDGALPPEAFPQEGLNLGRQLGLEVGSDRLGSGLLGLRYAVAVVNGNGYNVLNNDNNNVTPVGRLVLDLGDVLALGVNGYYDIQTVGTRPGRLTENRTGAGADLSLQAGGVSFLAMGLWRSTSHPTSGLATEMSLGAMAALSYLHKGTGIEVGGRFAYFEPSDVQPNDQQMEGAAMIGYRASFFPGRIIVQYTLRLEEPAASVPNNSIDALLQVSF